MPEAKRIPEYGPVMGVAVPQANTTVEPEMQALLGSGNTLLTARMTSNSSDSRQRLLDYFDDLARHLGQFDVAPLQVAGFACTGSSYLVGPEDEDRRLQALSASCGYPVLSASKSIRSALEMLGATRLALVSPYPDWLSDAGKNYWRSCGLTLTASTGLPSNLLDTRNIYKLQTPAVLEIFRGLDTTGCDAVLMSGTGMPSLRMMVQHVLPIPVLSSNFCLAWAMQSQLQFGKPDKALLHDMLSPQAAWRRQMGSGQ